MIYGSVCSGIEAASCAWAPLGWQCAFVSEIDAFPRAVLKHRWPDTPIHGDFTTIKAGEYRPIDLMVGGTPCQSFSVAGLRGGLADERGNLALEYLRLAQRLRPRWLVWENVPGVLSSSGGRDFGAILGGLVELGYGFAYRVLDAQFFGVPQRRRRVFVVGCLGDWRAAAAVLFERHSLSGYPAPRREESQGLAGTVAGGARKRGGFSYDDVPQVSAFGGNDTRGPIDIATAVNAHGGPHGRLDFESETFVALPLRAQAQPSHRADSDTYVVAHALRGEGFDASEDGTGRGVPIIPVAFSCKDHGADAGDVAPTLRGMGHDRSHANAGGQIAVAFNLRGRDGGAVPEIDAAALASMRAASGGSSRSYVAFAENSRAEVRLEGGDGQTVAALKQGGGKPGQSYPAIAGSAVRRLTPRECERLQGFPDDYTLIPWRKGEARDGPRYKALGNSMAVPVMSWIGRRIAAVDALQKMERAA